MLRSDRFFILLVLLIFAGCESKNQTENSERSQNKSLINYANRLDILPFEDSYQLVIKGKQGSYQITTSRQQNPLASPDSEHLEVPIKSIIVTSTSHLPPINYLQNTDALVGFPQTQWIYNSEIQRRVSKGNIQEVGVKNKLDIEKILKISPEVLMLYDEQNYNRVLSKIDGEKPQKILNVDYLESHPLGRAEWIKLFGVLFAKEKEADSIFTTIERNYQRLKDLTDSIQDRPTVISGSIYGDTWYMPGGNSWVARFIEDAGGEYLWNNDNEMGSLKLGYENVLSKGGQAEYWIGASNFMSLKEMGAADPRYKNFLAFQDSKIFTYTKQQIPQGGNNYLELGYLRPDLVLRDYVKILHPELLKEESFEFFEKLRSGAVKE